MAQIVFNKLYFASIDVPPVNTNQVIYINIDQNVHYDAFYDDFGPLNLAVLFRFCESLHAIVQVLTIVFQRKSYIYIFSLKINEKLSRIPVLIHEIG